MDMKALAFQQLKEAWLLRRFAPTAVTGYLFIWKYGIHNTIALTKLREQGHLQVGG
jgi:hypothetical protein